MSPSVKPAKTFLQKYGVEILLVTGAFVLLFLLLWFRLGSLTFGMAASQEVTSQQSAHSWHTILDNPLNAPYTVIQRLVLLTGHHGITSMRLVTTAWAIVAMILFYLVARQWHSVRVAALATWLFITSSWFLHTARLATPEILWIVTILAIVVLFSPRRAGFDNRLTFPMLIATLGAALYIPGMVWLVLLSIILRRENIADAWYATSSVLMRIVAIFGGLVLLAPLGRAMYYSPELLKPWLGIQEIHTPVVVAKQFLAVPKHLFICGPLDPVHWLGRLPILSVFEIVMFILGAYFYVSHIRAARSRFIIILSLLAWILIAVGGLVSLSLIVPAVYLILATGIAYMLHEWFKVFPNNPIARFIGVAIIAIAILLTSVYQTRSYFVAWRYSPDTAKVYTQKL
jgi:hypothetical protein